MNTIHDNWTVNTSSHDILTLTLTDAEDCGHDIAMSAAQAAAIADALTAASQPAEASDEYRDIARRLLDSGEIGDFNRDELCSPAAGDYKAYLEISRHIIAQMQEYVETVEAREAADHDAEELQLVHELVSALTQIFNENPDDAEELTHNHPDLLWERYTFHGMFDSITAHKGIDWNTNEGNAEALELFGQIVDIAYKAHADQFNLTIKKA